MINKSLLSLMPNFKKSIKKKKTYSNLKENIRNWKVCLEVSLYNLNLKNMVLNLTIFFISCSYNIIYIYLNKIIFI